MHATGELTYFVRRHALDFVGGSVVIWWVEEWMLKRWCKYGERLLFSCPVVRSWDRSGRWLSEAWEIEVTLGW